MRRLRVIPRCGVGIWLLFAALASNAAAVPQDSGLEAARISPTLYFVSAREERETRETLHARVNAFEKEISVASEDSLPDLLGTAEQLLISLQRHTACLRLQYLEDTTDESVKAAADSVSTDRSVLNAALNRRLAQVPPVGIPTLGRYARLATQAQQDAAHSLSPDAARYRGSVTLPAQASIADAYHRLIGTIGNQGASSRDLETRRAAITRRDEAYNRTAPAVAALLGTLIDLQNRDAVAQRYADAADRKYSSLELSDALVTQTLAGVEAQSAIYREYEQVIAEHAGRKLGVSPVLPAEVGLAATPWPRIPLQQARQLVLDALAPLGGDYTRRFAQLLDPANGRLDLTGGSHRARTGTSIAVYDAPVAFFFTGYNGSLSSIGTMAHEGGHAIHRELMNVGGAPVYERTGPHYLFEGFAIFNELLVFDHAARIAKTPVERTSALETLLQSLSFELFVSAEETSFERSLYKAASGHAALDRGDVDAIYSKSIAPYEDRPLAETVASREWMSKPLLFEDPLYLVNYLYAQLVAVALYSRSQTDPNFASEYEGLLRRGFDADAQVLLGSLKIRLDDPKLLEAAAKLIRSKTGELRDLYQAETASPQHSRNIE